MTQGIDTSALHDSIRVQDDLFRHVNGHWLAEAKIAPDRATAGAFVDLDDNAEKAVRQIIESIDLNDPILERRQIAHLFASFMNEDLVEQAGGAPLQDDLARIENVKSVADFIALLGEGDRDGWPGLFGMYIAPDKGQPDRYTTYVMQSGLGLPDESYYKTEQTAEIRIKYLGYLGKIFSLAGLDDVESRAERVLELETKIAQHHWDRVKSRDAQATYNPMDRATLSELIPSFDWTSWLSSANYPTALIENTIVAQPSFFSGINELLSAENLAAWRDWLRRLAISSAAPYLSSDFVNANFDFYGRTLSGTDQLRERWKRAIDFTESAVGETVGKLYVEIHYQEIARTRMNELIHNLIEAYRESITNLPWMSLITKQKALAKLDLFTPKVGHPVKWRDYSKLHTDPNDLLGNVKRSHAVALEHELAKLGAPIDRDEWHMTPQTVNAYYNPTMNEIVFPAAILQPPFFNSEADDAVNYGAIAAVIGHEIGHGFDDQGSQYDGTGELSNWWTDEDRKAFEDLTKKLIEQYNELSPDGADGKKVNGALTIGENIGDLGGLGIAYKALRRAIGDNEPERIDGLTADQRFFISWAQAWKAKVRPEETVRRLTIDPHSPPEFRCNQVVRNIDAFYKAFDVQPGDALWLDPEHRVEIW